jgi:phosphoribosylglycinamide formyltransferase-1
MKNIVVLISGRGSNLQALLQTAEQENWRDRLDAAITAVISNRADAAGLEIARRAGMPTAIVEHLGFASREDFDRALAAEINRHHPTLIVLAGFMRVLTPGFVRQYSGRIINVHPSLLPCFPGLKTHEQALAAGVRVHGATVHFVGEQVDAGGIIAQAVVAVRPDDDAATLASRVLEQEHCLLPHAVRLVLEERVRWLNGRVIVADAAPLELARLAQ